MTVLVIHDDNDDDDVDDNWCATAHLSMVDLCLYLLTHSKVTSNQSS